MPSMPGALRATRDSRSSTPTGPAPFFPRATVSEGTLRRRYARLSRSSLLPDRLAAPRAPLRFRRHDQRRGGGVDARRLGLALVHRRRARRDRIFAVRAVAGHDVASPSRTRSSVLRDRLASRRAAVNAELRAEWCARLAAQIEQQGIAAVQTAEGDL